jgi:hypothetical protein
MDISKAWPAAAGIQSWQRTLMLDRKDIIRITDQYNLNAPAKSITQTFMTVADASTDKPGVIVFTLPNGKTVSLLYDAAKWEASKEKAALTSPEDQGLIHNWHERSIYRILLTAKTPAAKGSFTYIIR